MGRGRRRAIRNASVVPRKLEPHDHTKFPESVGCKIESAVGEEFVLGYSDAVEEGKTRYRHDEKDKRKPIAPANFPM